VNSPKKRRPSRLLYAQYGKSTTLELNYKTRLKENSMNYFKESSFEESVLIWIAPAAVSLGYFEYAPAVVVGALNAPGDIPGSTNVRLMPF
jgi:hypothetical protein